ncbi:unnamed protein product [Phaedon cochleariae]|uniref:m7GpppX diphosphatase n=1 Tax=Phaedon cochleariae TaxID=80249 RepID=A0A9N9SIK5_PHACE|nr:unnamed protein product [Phaedon cochleariae]
MTTVDSSYVSTTVDDLLPVEPKLSKLDSAAPENIHDILIDLSHFKVTKVLQNNTNRKVVCLQGTFESKEGDAVVILEKTAFAEENLNNTDCFTVENTLEKVFQNDIYGDYKYFPGLELSTIKTTIIHPATEKHIVKFSTQRFYMVNETPTIYSNIVLPALCEEESNLQWVYNILEHKSETERIVYEDPDPETGFILVPDLKWSGEVDTLYLLAIVNKHHIKSLRDLTQEHLPLLQNIRDKGIEAIKTKYSLDASQLRIYLHYQPSFYHLHIHFCCLKHEAPGILAEKAHLLSNVISNIELLSDYYQKVTIPFAVRENDKLFKKLECEGILNKC